jgi:hypothetical protein
VSVVVAQYGQRLIAAGATLHLDLERTPLLLFGEDGERARASKPLEGRKR